MPAATTLTGAELLAGVQSATNVKITANQILALVGGGVGGSTTQLQYNNAGVFGGVSGWTTNGSTALTGGASTTLALGGATIGANALAVTGTAAFSGSVSTSGGNITASVGTVQGAAFLLNPASAQLSWNARAILTSPAAGSLQFGAADAAAPVAQTIGPQSVVAGTSNTNGAAFTIRGSAGTGTGVGGSLIFQVATAGSTGSTQNTYATAVTIGQDRITTFSAGIVATSISASGNLLTTTNVLAGSGGLVGWSPTKSLMSSPVDGSIRLTNAAQLDFGLLQLGGTTSSFPALKRSTTTLQARLADDSAFTNIQGKLTTDTAYAVGTVVPTGVLTLYDSTGTAYRVPCLV